MLEYRGVLIVDDSATSRMIIQRCLEMAGVRTASYFQAENGLDALAILRSLPDPADIDLVITDLNMPKMDGRAFARQLKADPKFNPMKVLVASSIADGDAEAELLGLGILAVVKKPVSPAKLLDVLGGE
ncbi:response regulator [Treponema sp.]